MIEQEEQQRQAIADAKPGLDANAMTLAMAIGGQALPVGVSDPVATTDTGLDRGDVLMPTRLSPPTAGKLEMSSMTTADIEDWAVNAYGRSNKAITDPATRASMDLIVLYNDKEDPTADRVLEGLQRGRGLCPRRHPWDHKHRRRNGRDHLRYR